MGPWNNPDVKMYNFEQTFFKCIHSASIHAINQHARKALRSKHSFHFVLVELRDCLKQVYLIPFSKACFLLVCTGPRRLSGEVQRTTHIIIAFAFRPLSNCPIIVTVWKGVIMRWLDRCQGS